MKGEFLSRLLRIFVGFAEVSWMLLRREGRAAGCSSLKEWGKWQDWEKDSESCLLCNKIHPEGLMRRLGGREACQRR